MLKWIRKEHALVQQRMAHEKPARCDKADIIEMDEIYTYVQKNGSGQ